MSSIILNFISKNIYWVCLFVGIGGIFAYISGFKKGGKISMLCIVIYWMFAAVCSIK